MRRQIASEITELNKADQARSDLLQAIKEQLDRVGLTVTIDKDTGVLRASGGTDPRERESSTLNNFAQRNVDAASSRPSSSNAIPTRPLPTSQRAIVDRFYEAALPKRFVANVGTTCKGELVALLASLALR